jgi:hypothetical protein
VLQHDRPSVMVSGLRLLDSQTAACSLLVEALLTTTERTQYATPSGTACHTGHGMFMVTAIATH